MCSPACIEFTKKVLSPEHVSGKRVLEVGSLDINGSVRSHIESLVPSSYRGTDIIEGPGVDILCPADLLAFQFGKESFDLVISTCTLEHIKDWKSAIINIKRVCKIGGHVLIIVPQEWPKHLIYDYWRFSKEDLEFIFSDFAIFHLEQDFGEYALSYLLARKISNYMVDLSTYHVKEVK